METQRLSRGETARAAQLLRAGEAVAVPTETVYGLASDATNREAVHKNYEAKGRPETKPLNVLVDGMDMVRTVCRDVPEDAYRLAEAFWPGPLTMILWGNGTLPDIVPAGGATQGVRCPVRRKSCQSDSGSGTMGCASAAFPACRKRALTAWGSPSHTARSAAGAKGR